jgi:RimJ/RimL family protein N-acetyltransferase
MSPADLDFVAAMLAAPEVMRYYPKVYSREEAKQWIERQLDRYAKHAHGLWLALDKITGEARGQVGLIEQQVRGIEEPEVAYLIHRPFWRQGFATEAATAVREYAFAVLGKPYVISLIRPENLPSQGVAAKLGMTSGPGLVQHGGFPHLVFTVHREPGRAST